jgi:membrane protease YdiL (CAAX protease family)
VRVGRGTAFAIESRVLAAGRSKVLTYFALAFAISWGGVLLVIGSGSIPGTPTETDRLFPFVYLAMLAGPTLSGLLVTALFQGRTGLRELRSRLLAWRVSLRWYAAALVIAPAAVTATLLALSLASPEFRPGIFSMDDKASRLLFGLGVGIGAGIFEELGWTGVAVPELRRRHGVLATGLIVGLLWAAWHVLAVLWGGAAAIGSVSPAIFVPIDLLSALPVYRVLMVWVYDRTQSLSVAMLMHASLTATVIVLGPAASGTTVLTYDVVLAAVLWAVVWKGGSHARHLTVATVH